MPLVAIVGNPNAGKTTLFNALTGSHQKVGNYPGVTVEKVSGYLSVGNRTVEVTDVPGLYSLAPVSEDERVAVGVIEGRGVDRQPDLLVCVVDATNLERNLYLFTQVAEAGIPTVVALTMVDRLEQSGSQLDLTKFASLLGVDVVPIVGHKEKGIDDLGAAISRNLENPNLPKFDLDLPGILESRVALLRERFARVGADFTKAEVRRELLQPTEEMVAYLRNFPEMEEAFAQARKDLRDEGMEATADVENRYRWAGMVQLAVVQDRSAAPPKRSLTDRLDTILTHRLFGFAIFVGIMYLVFQSIYSFSTPLMDGIDWMFGRLKEFVSPQLESAPVLQSLVVDGIIGGVGGVLVFLPQILILFFFISVMEGTGYLARAAFLMDRMLGWCGLNGRAFIPLLSSFACAIPGIMAARVMPDPKSRLATILVAPLMSCSARLPVYLLIIGAFVEPKFGPFWAGFALFAMHFLGLLLAIPIVWLLNRKMLKGRRLPFLLELPPYQWPKWKDVGLAMVMRGRIFVKTAGTIIVFMSILIWAASYFPRLSPAETSRIAASAPAETADKRIAEASLANSFLGRFGKTIEPVFRPAGFDWRITTAILSAFPARETVVPSLGIIFALGDDVDDESIDLRTTLNRATWPDGRPLFTPWTAVGLMVFFSLCAQCMATLATVKRETNSWKWPLFMFTYMTLLAYAGAVFVNYLGIWFGK
ncbi:MAG TPA: ferrous iron transport protein B [Fimbriimonas sp.]